MNDEDLKELAAALKDIRYPKGMICPVGTEIAGRGYYPVFKGFENGADPHGGVMFLNRDFGGIDYYTELSSEYPSTHVLSEGLRRRDAPVSVIYTITAKA